MLSIYYVDVESAARKQKYEKNKGLELRWTPKKSIYFSTNKGLSAED